MKKLSISRPYQPKMMNFSARENLSKRIFAIHSQIFEGVNKEQFIRYVIEPATRTTKIYIIQNTSQEDVGYLTFQKFEARVNGRLRFVYRTEIGMLPAYRGNNTTVKTLPKEITKAYIASGFRKSYFLATPIHPNPYCVVYNHGLSVYPHPERITSPSIISVMDKLSEALQIAKVGVHSRFEKKVGWIVKQNPAKRSEIAAQTDAASRFYLSQNPEYFKGNGMMMLVPIHPLQGLRLLVSLVRWGIQKKNRSTHQIGFGSSC